MLTMYLRTFTGAAAASIQTGSSTYDSWSRLVSSARLEAWRTGWRRAVGWLERDAACGFGVGTFASRVSSVAPLWSLPFHRGGVEGGTAPSRGLASAAVLRLPRFGGGGSACLRDGVGSVAAAPRRRFASPHRVEGESGACVSVVGGASPALAHFLRVAWCAMAWGVERRNRGECGVGGFVLSVGGPVCVCCGGCVHVRPLQAQPRVHVCMVQYNVLASL